MKTIMGIHKPIDGKIIFKIDRSRLSISDQILLYLLGKKLAYEAKLTGTDSCSLLELSRELGVNEKLVSARLSDLIKAGKVERLEKGIHRIHLMVINEVINRLEGALSEK